MSKMYVVKMETSKWWGEKSYTKVGIAIKENRIYIEHLAGAAMPKEVIKIPFMIRELRNELKKFLEDYRRVQEFKVQVRYGQSGCEDYTLKTRTITEAGFQNVRTRARLHISCNDKLNEYFEPMYLGDFLEIADKVFESSKQSEDQTVRNIIEDLSTNCWKKISKKQFRKMKVTNVWKVKEAIDEDGWKTPEEAI